MATPKKWSGVAIAMQSALATAVVITGITKASPAVVSYTDAGSSDPNNGAYVLLKLQGMSELDYAVGRVANVSGVGNTFELEGVDSTLFGTFTSGTFEVVTFGTSLTSATTVNAAGGDFDFIDTTTISGTVRTQMPDLPNAVSFNFENIWDPSDAGLLAMKAASDAQSIKAFKFNIGGRIVVFSGYVGASLVPGGTKLVTTPTVLTAAGRLTYFAS